MKFLFSGDGKITMISKPFKSQVFNNIDVCPFTIMAGTGPIRGKRAGFGFNYSLFNECMVNPSVNPFPFNGQMWLTIDQAWWGRVDPQTLETIPAQVKVDSSILSAHPACDHTTNECFSNYPCKAKFDPTKKLSSMWSDEICIGKFVADGQDGLQGLSVVEVSRVKLPRALFTHHSHAPCMTKNFIIVKLDSFHFKKPVMQNNGLLRYVNQLEDNLWMVMDRRTNESRVLDSGDFKFVNNHFLNCYEEDDHMIVDTSPATNMYLDNYFDFNLHEDDRKWDTIMMPGRRCTIPIDTSVSSFNCTTLITSGDWHGLFDFPTYNPLWKSNPESQYWYATAPVDASAKWMNSVIKGHTKERKVLAMWKEEGVYTTEANFIPRPGASEEDDGVLFSIMYDSKVDQSMVVLLNAKDLSLIGKEHIGFVVPYHSHGVLCNEKGKCFSNP